MCPATAGCICITVGGKWVSKTFSQVYLIIKQQSWISKALLWRCLCCYWTTWWQSLTMTLFACVADKACVSKVWLWHCLSVLQTKHASAKSDYNFVCLCCRQSMQQQSLTMTLFVCVADKACNSKVWLWHCLSVLQTKHASAKSDYDTVCLCCRQSMHQQSLTMTLFVCAADKGMHQQSLTMTLFVCVADKICISKILLGHYCLVVLALITHVFAKWSLTVTLSVLLINHILAKSVILSICVANKPQ